jgi:DNA-binding XRE family transcriptional regulator
MSLRTIREAAGLTQRALAERAGVSRQLVGAVETGRHLPRVDAALALARALDVDVGELFGAAASLDVVEAVTGETPPPGSLVRLGRVGDRYVSAPLGVSSTGFEPGDAVIEEGEVRHLTRLDAGVVVLGCEPGLVVLEQMLREKGIGALSAATSSRQALSALEHGRAHAAVVHGPVGELPPPPPNVEVARFGLARWQVGLAAASESSGAWWEDALSGSSPVIQRERGAGVQQTFEGARSSPPPPGPVVATHLEAARRAVLTGLCAVTIEPAARAVGAVFHPLDVHVAEFWVDSRWLGGPQVGRALDTLADRRFQQRLEVVGGYDLAGCGARVA